MISTMKATIAVAALVFCSSGVYAQSIARTCPTNICYALNIPDATAQSGNGDIYFQMSAPTSSEWVALGQGTRMAGSNIFVMYTSGNGQNVTVSPRLGTGHVEPQHDTNAQITLLEGSGVSNGVMTANVRCSNCNSWQGGTMDFTGSSSSWIYAYKSGSPLNSDDPAADIPMHDDSSTLNWNLAQARGGSSTNPFVTAAATTGSNNSTSSNSTTTTTSSSSSSQNLENSVQLAHAALASLAFIAFFPFGAILIRVANFTGVVWFHAAAQIFGYMAQIASFGMGLWMAINGDYLTSDHAIIGIIVFCLVSFQPISGLLHHSIWKKKATRSLVTYEHVGIGRIAIILGMINGGLGLKLAGAERGAKIAYGVCAGFVGVVYLGVIVWGEMRKKSPPTYQQSESRQGSSETSQRFRKPDEA